MEQIIIENGGTTGISNYSAVVAAVKERLKTYEGLVVMEDAIPQAKQEVANLRRVAKTASDLRISVKKEHEAKISETISQLKEITDLYTLAANKIDSQVKEFETKADREKEEQIRAYWDGHVGKLKEFIPIDAVWNPKWLNKGYALPKIMEEIDDAVQRATSGMRTILAMKTPHQQTLLRTLFTTLDMQKVMDEKLALDEQEAKMEAEKSNAQIASNLTHETISSSDAQSMPEAIKTPLESDFKQYTLSFKVTATRNQFLALREFLIANNIKFVKGE